MATLQVPDLPMRRFFTCGFGPPAPLRDRPRGTRTPSGSRTSMTGVMNSSFAVATFTVSLPPAISWIAKVSTSPLGLNSPRTLFPFRTGTPERSAGAGRAAAKRIAAATTGASQRMGTPFFPLPDRTARRTPVKGGPGYSPPFPPSKCRPTAMPFLAGPPGIPYAPPFAPSREPRIPGKGDPRRADGRPGSEGDQGVRLGEVRRFRPGRRTRRGRRHRGPRTPLPRDPVLRRPRDLLPRHPPLRDRREPPRE